MKQELFSIGPFTVYSYGLMIAIGIIAAFVVAEKRAKKLMLNADLVFNLTIWCAVGGIIGAKVLYYITILPDVISNPSLLLDFSDGFVVYGGIIFGILAGYLFCKKNKLDFLEYFDLVMPSIALAQGFGRIGCHLAGCCFGEETSCAVHVRFPLNSLAPSGVDLIPTQLISSGLNFIHFAILVYFAKYKKGKGQVAGMYLMLYSIGRFVIEFFRGDILRGSVGVLSTSQFISIFVFFAGVTVFVLSGKYAKVKASNTTNDNENV